jgi:hypothetical protein
MKIRRRSFVLAVEALDRQMAKKCRFLSGAADKECQSGYGGRIRQRFENKQIREHSEFSAVCAAVAVNNMRNSCTNRLCNRRCFAAARNQLKMREMAAKDVSLSHTPISETFTGDSSDGSAGLTPEGVPPIRKGEKISGQFFPLLSGGKFPTTHSVFPASQTHSLGYEMKKN